MHAREPQHACRVSMRTHTQHTNRAARIRRVMLRCGAIHVRLQCARAHFNRPSSMGCDHNAMASGGGGRRRRGNGLPVCVCVAHTHHCHSHSQFAKRRPAGSTATVRTAPRSERKFRVFNDRAIRFEACTCCAHYCKRTRNTVHR